MRVTFAANFPPPYTGQTIITQNLVDLLGPIAAVSVSTVRLGRSLHLPSIIAKIDRLLRLPTLIRAAYASDVVYFVVPSSTLGFLIELLLIVAVSPFTAIVVHSHNGDFDRMFQGWRRRLGRILGARADLLFVSSKKLASDEFEDVGLTVRILSNPTDKSLTLSDEKVRRAQSSRYGTVVGDFRVVYLSNFVRGKGYEYVLQAADLLRHRKDVTWSMVGAFESDAVRREVLSYIGRNALDCVELLGPVQDRNVVADILSTSHLFVLPTRYKRESHPMSIIEALGCGTPVAATAHASIPEMFEDGQQGSLLRGDLPSALARFVAQLSGHPERWLQLSESARALYMNRYHPSIVRDDFVSALLSIGARGVDIE